MAHTHGLAARTAANPQTSPGTIAHRKPVSQPTPHGQPLDGATGAAMSARFGHDFSQVKIHAGTPAGQAADALGADAFTSGNDIVFGEGAYAPGSESSERLLAHELTHVVQQDRFGPGTAGFKSRRSDPSEQEAENVADRVMAGDRVDVRSAPRAALSCFDPGYNDIKDDFWNTKSTFGKQDGSVIDSAINTAWDVAGLIPEVPSALSAGIDVAKAGYSEGMSTLYGWEGALTGSTADNMRSKQYDEAAGSFMGDAAVDATGMIPIYGQGQSALGALWDGARTIDIAHGANPDGSPSFGDIQKQGGQQAASAVAPTPAPSQDSDTDQPPPNMPSDPWQGLQ